METVRSAEPNRKFCFSLIEKFLGERAKLKNVKQNFLFGRPPLCGGWRWVSEGFAFWICVSDLAG